ncbi:MAG: hypothetical protein HC817_11765 [Saprospiraceae bacterium]|nr:hypothetical protein [Saprospiraceae bacterium]
MTKPKALLLMTIFSFSYLSLWAQDEPTETSSLSGSLQANGNFFMRDSAIGAYNIPQYDRQLVGSDSWLSINYNKAGYEIGVRFDIFNNSQLQNPKASYSAAGLGRWFLKKKIDKLGIYVGYIYDQIGTGIIFRSYEERPLGVDNALLGVQLSYELTENWRIKGFSGRHKQQFDLYKAHTTGFNTEGYIEKGQLSLAPGFGVLHRNLDDETVGGVVNTIATYAKADSIGATFNTYAATLYNTLNFGKWTLYTEAAYKTPEVMFSPFSEKINRDGTISEGKFVNQAGWVIYGNLGFNVEKTDENWGIGLLLEAKRTEGFNFRTTPLATLNRGFVNYLPPMSRQNTYRLTSRYVPATQELGEQALQLDLKLSPSDVWQIDMNASNILTLNSQQLYREFYLSFLRKNEHTQITFGVQHQNYNQAVYEVKPMVENVQTITIFFGVSKKFIRHKNTTF